MVFDRLIKLNDIINDLQMIDDVLRVLRQPDENREIKKQLEFYSKHFPIWCWLAQKKYFFGW